MWLVHDPYWAKQEVKTVGKYRERVDDEIPRVVVHGHLHRATIELYHGVLFVNPGSPTFLDYRQGLGTVAILTINAQRVAADFVRL